MKATRKIHFLARDITNRVRYGTGAPRCCERIWIRASAVRHYLPEERILHGKGRDCTARVIRKAQWPGEMTELDELPKIRYCIMHWKDGVPWEATGILEHMMAKIEKKGRADKCTSREDVLQRCRRLDDIFRQVAAEGVLRTQQQLGEAEFREHGGVFMHIGPDAEPIFSGHGFHRLAMAKVLDIWLPAEVGCVHEDALARYPALRTPPP